MLHGKLIHPEILGVLGTLGHGSRVLICDGNYPIATRSGHAAQVYLNLSPGVVTATQALEAIVAAVPVESACVMRPEEGPEPAIFAEFRELLDSAGAPSELEPLDRFAFYDAGCEDDVGLAIHTAERRIYANLLLTIGVIPPGD